MIIDLRSFNFVKPGFRWEFADPKNVRNPSTSWCQNQWLHGFPRKKRIPTKMARWKVEMLWYVLNCWYLMICSCTLGLGIHVTCYIPTFFFTVCFHALGWGFHPIFWDKTEVLQPVVFWWVFSTCWCSWMPYKQPLSGFQNAGTRRSRKRCKGAVFFGAMVWGCLQEKTNKTDSICVIKKSDVRCGTSHGEDEFEWFWGTFASPLEKTWLCKLFRVFRGFYDPLVWGL